MQVHNGEIKVIGSWNDVAGNIHDKYLATSFHEDEGVPCETYTFNAAEFFLWLIDTRVESKKFRLSGSKG